MRARSKEVPRLDAANLAGITALMNTQHVQHGVDLEAAEKHVMGKSRAHGERPDGDPVKAYTDELNQIANELGINLMGDDDELQPPRKQAPPAKVAAPATQRPVAGRAPPRPPITTGNIMKLIDKVSVHSAKSTKSSRTERSKRSKQSKRSKRSRQSKGGSSWEDSSDEEDSESDCDCDSECSSRCSCCCHEESSTSSGGTSGSTSSGEDDEVNSVISRMEAELGLKTTLPRSKVKLTDIPKAEPRRSRPPTMDQAKESHIDSVFASIRGETQTVPGEERERIQDIKASKLEQISQLRMQLEEEEIDCSGVGVPTNASPMEEIDSILNILRLKNDRNRYSTFAEEVILTAAEGIETVFDGTTAIPLVGWKPDYTGYHNTVSAKLHRMRGETARVVGEVISKYSLGPMTRIIMELLPSFFLYPRTQKKQRGQPGLSRDPHVADARSAIASIRRADDPGMLSEI